MVVFSQQKTMLIKNDTTTIVQKKFNTKSLNAYKTDKDFDYSESTTTQEPTFLERIFNWLSRQFLRFLEWFFGVKYAKGILANILMTLPYIIAALVLFLLIRFFINTQTKSIISTAHNKNIIHFSDDENLLQTDNLNELIYNAIEAKNYRLAVRYLYLLMLKNLKDKELIKWELQKTNEDYIKELSEKSLKKAFENSTRFYDFIWYGNFDINKLQFNNVKLDFERVEEIINQQKIG